MFLPLAVNAVISAALFVVLWLINLRTRDPSFIDSWWALGLVVMAAATFVMTGGGDPHRWLLTSICAAWGLRLGGYLLWRWRKQGPDRRYSRR
jgi:steroid 5-alpha reductase family enzyme